MSRLHALVPDGYDDPAQVSGGNVYDRRVLSALADSGRPVVVHPVAHGWPQPEVGLDRAVGAALRAIPDGAIVLVDGLLTAAAERILEHGQRLRLVVLAHMADPPGGPHPAVAASAKLTVATSAWTARRLVDRFGLLPDMVVVAEPGVDPADLCEPSPDGGRLLCVAAVTRGKGHDVLMGALAGLRDRAWTCVCAGSLDRDPAYVARLRELIAKRGLSDRVDLVGALDGAGMGQAYGAADLLVHPSRSESYGLVVTEALARALPVIATDVGGVAQALGRSADGGRPGVLVPVDDELALTRATADWLDDPALRSDLRARAALRRRTLTSWSDTAQTIAQALARLVT